MKPKSRFFVQRAPLGLALTLVLCPITQIYATDGTWTTDGSSNWSNSSNWAGGIVANGAGFTADFSTIDITGDRTVQLDTARTIGHLVFGDTAGLGTQSWILGNGGDSANSLTLDGTASPSITTHANTSINTVIDGSLGFHKAGAGRLVLNQANTYSGTTWIRGGEIAISGAGTLGNGSTNLLITGGSLDLGGTTQTVNSVSSFTGDNSLGFPTIIEGDTDIKNGSLVASDFYELNGTVSANLGGTASLYAGNSNVGGNVVILTGTNTFSGNTYLSNSGSLIVASPNSLYNGDVSQWTSAKISVAASSYLGFEGLTASQASQAFGNLSNSVDGQGLNAGSLIGFGLTSGNQTWNAPLTDSTGNTGGRIHISIRKDGGTLTLAQTGTFTGELWILGADTRFGANNATGISILETGDKLADLNGFSGTYKGGEPNWVNTNQTTSSTLTMFVPLIDADSLSNPDPVTYATGNFGGSIGVNDESSGSIHLVKGGQGDAQFDGAINLSVKSISINSGSLVFNSHTAHGNGSSLTTTVNNSGKLFINGSLESSIGVLAGGLLGGHGDVSYGVTSVAAGGTVSPGGKISRESGLPGEDPSSFNTPIGSLKLGEIHFANNSTYAYEADSSPMLVGSADLLIVQGDLNIHSMVQLAFANVADTPASFSPGTIFSLINYVGTWNGGLFYRGTNALEEGEEFFMGQNYWVINYEEATGGLNFTEDYISGGRFVTLTATAIPEPSTAILAASTTFLLLRRRRAELSQLRQ